MGDGDQRGPYQQGTGAQPTVGAWAVWAPLAHKRRLKRDLVTIVEDRTSLELPELKGTDVASWPGRGLAAHLDVGCVGMTGAGVLHLPKTRI